MSNLIYYTSTTHKGAHKGSADLRHKYTSGYKTCASAFKAVFPHIPLYYQKAEWHCRKHALMCHGARLEERDVSGLFESSRYQDVWVFPDGSWLRN